MPRVKGGHGDVATSLPLTWIDVVVKPSTCHLHNFSSYSCLPSCVPGVSFFFHIIIILGTQKLDS